MENNKQKRKSNKFAKVVRNIQNTALNNSYRECELTYQQALSVHLRSQQLVREGGGHSNKPSRKNILEQINKCYEQRNKQLYL